MSKSENVKMIYFACHIFDLIIKLPLYRVLFTCRESSWLLSCQTPSLSLLSLLSPLSLPPSLSSQLPALSSQLPYSAMALSRVDFLHYFIQDASHTRYLNRIEAIIFPDTIYGSLD